MVWRCSASLIIMPNKGNFTHAWMDCTAMKFGNLPGLLLLPRGLSNSTVQRTTARTPPPAAYWADPLGENVLLILWYLGYGKMITLPRHKGQNLGIPLSINMTAWLLWSLRLNETCFVSEISNGLNEASPISFPKSWLQTPFICIYIYIIYFPFSSIIDKCVFLLIPAW